ncbi:MAG: hypothetical protein QNJ65_02945 [Xenococcaceae cyanobacterium MO_234.B1]|nr:hypothetical protein [Xenococcaceae cyanobacterium MO_234.B1]
MIIPLTYQQRRVHTVHLSAPSETLVRRGAILLEDALHAASLPDAEGGRLLLIRSLDVGKIDSRQSSASLVLNVEQRLHQLASSAIHALDLAAPRQPAVYFRDRAEAYIALALKLARGENTDAWFWPLAVPHWQPNLRKASAFRQLLWGVAQTPTGIVAVATLVRELQEYRVLGPLLSSLRSPDGAALLQLCGWSQLNLPLSLVKLPSPASKKVVSPTVTNALRQGIDLWGAEDTRSLWLAAVLLVAEKPARVLEPRLIERSQELIKRVIWGQKTKQVKSQKHRDPALSSGAPDSSVREAKVKSNPKSTIQNLKSNDKDIGEKPQRTTVGEDREQLSKSPDDLTTSKPEGETFLEGRPPTLSQQLAGTQPKGEVALGHGLPEESNQSQISPIEGKIPGDWRSPEVLERSATSPPGEETENLLGKRDDKEDKEDKAARKATPKISSPSSSPASPSSLSHVSPFADNPQPTAYAGLFFLLPLLKSLGIEAFLEEHPHLIDLDLPQRLLYCLGERLAIPPDDPVLAAFTEVDSMAELESCEFMAPISWREGICNPGAWVIRSLSGQSGTRILWDSSGRLPLALWRGKATVQVRNWLGESSLKRGRIMAAEPDCQILLKAWLTAMRRWCRRYGRLGLHDLVCRPGRISVTRTHVDLFFDHRQADIRIRRAGLDRDPGWLPWFGRVVLFHYLYDA